MPRLEPALAVLAVTIGLAPSASAGAPANGIVDAPVSFDVVNTNTSDVPCVSDGAPYVVRGRLVGPRAALSGRRSRAVTVWLHGYNVGEFMWAPPGAPALDMPMALARRGHVSLTVDRVGYDRSGHPNGHLSCLGSQADVAQQLVDKLRSGDYDVPGGSAPTFRKVVLGGHDSGAVIADIAAYSYDDVDGVIHFNWADQGYSDTTRFGYAGVLQTCRTGGQPAEQGPPARDDPPGGPAGYAQFLTDEQIRAVQYNTDPALVARLERMWNRNPCGEFEHVPVVAQINIQRLPDVRVPVLYGYTDHEFVWTQEGLAQQAQHFRGSPDLTTVVIQDAGHFPQFSREAPAFHDAIAGWLRSRRLVSTAKKTGRRRA